jgi:SAM-dependent methyltransferase
LGSKKNVDKRLMSILEQETIATIHKPDCYLCGSSGKYLYKNLQDRLFGVGGHWYLKQCLNPECGLAWLDPMPTREDISKAYLNYYTHEDIVPNGAQKCIYNSFREVYLYLVNYYIALRFGSFSGAFFPPNLIRLLPYANALFPHGKAAQRWSSAGLESHANPHLLDVGCGSGELLLLLRSMGWNVQGIDTDPVAVEKASAKDLDVRLGSLADQEFPEDHFDIIIMNHVIEHVHDPVGLLTECHRILRSRGRLIMITPNFSSWGHRIFKDSWRGLEAPRHLYLYDPRNLRIATDLAGLKVQSLVTSANNAKWFYLASLALLSKGNVLNQAPSLMEEVTASGFAVLEWALIKLKLKLGEEVVLVADKVQAR